MVHFNEHGAPALAALYVYPLHSFQGIYSQCVGTMWLVQPHLGSCIHGIILDSQLSREGSFVGRCVPLLRCLLYLLVSKASMFVDHIEKDLFGVKGIVCCCCFIVNASDDRN